MRYLQFGILGILAVVFISFQTCNKGNEGSGDGSSTGGMKFAYSKSKVNRTQSGTVTQQIIGGGYGVRVCTAYELTEGENRSKTCDFENEDDFVVLNEQPSANDERPDKWEYDEAQDIWQSTLTFPEDPVILRTGTYTPYGISEDGSQQVKGPTFKITK